MKLFQSARTLLTILLMVMLVAGLTACGGTGGEADTEAPLLTLARVPVSTLERTRLLSGTVEPGAQLEVSRNSVVVSNPLPDANGNWSDNIDLVPGVNSISVKATDATGNNQTLAFSLLYEVFTLDQVLLATSVQGQTLSGTLANGGSLSGKLTRTSDGVEVQDIPAITANNWTQALNVLPDDTYTLSLTGTDDIAQITPLTLALVLDASLPVVTVDPASPVEATVTVNGTFATDSTVSVVGANGVVVDTLTQDSGTQAWSATLSGLLPGRNQIDVTATRAADDKQGTARLFVLHQP